MAAYAALVSLMHTIEQIEQHPRPPISLDKQQVESLTEKVTFLQKFLEGYSLNVGYSNEADPLEMRIADAAYAAEDVIESNIADRILDASTSRGEDFSSGEEISAGEEINSDEEINSGDKIYSGEGTSYNQEISAGEKISSDVDLYEGLQKAIEEMESIKKEVMEIKEKMGVQHQLHRSSSISGGSLRASSTGQNTMVGFDDVLLEIMDKLTGGQPDRQIIPIVGMGGIGKTTLARNIYHNRGALEHFNILAWATISQKYRMEEILLELLQEDKECESQMNEYELIGDKLYKRLSGRRYLIIIDDIWDIQVWVQLRRFFPDNKNGSRIVITTRISNFQLTDSYVLNMRFLDEEKSWSLFSKIVFGEEGCPIELEEIGEMIVENCKGLPLSIVVVGGLLAKSERTREYWEYIAENLNSIVNSEDNENCLKVLHMSYTQLPIYLKPCYLYMGVFPEDRKIRVSELIELWVAEGFLKPISGKSLEKIAYEYLKELINRNLVSVHQLEFNENIKYCNIHDLLRNLCLREAQKERFYNVIRQHSLTVPVLDLSTQRRVVVPDNTSRDRVLNALQFMSLSRSLICDSMKILPLRNFRLLRIMSCPHFDYTDRLKDLLKLVNLRYLVLNARWVSKIPSSVYLLWNLHTLIVHIGEETGPFEIWNMSQLRHLEFGKGLYLPDPPGGKVSGRDDIVLENLQTLGTIINFKWCEEVIKRIPNIKELKVDYYHNVFEEGSCDYCLNNLERLDKLESLYCQLAGPRASDILHNLTFPCSLKKLTLNVWHVHWEDMLEKIGSLPFLGKLKLIGGSFKECKWETVEGQFLSLKFLQIERCKDLEDWTTESSHFPCLERLVLIQLQELKEIPSEIGEISTLKSIKLARCSNSVVISAKEILEEQEELYGEVGLQVRVSTWDFEQKELVWRLASPNFQLM